MFARAEIKPQLQNIDQEKVKKLYADLRRESSQTGGVPITVRNIILLIILHRVCGVKSCTV